jgi:hypothetical protein
MRTIVANVVLVLIGVTIGMYVGVRQAGRYYFRLSCKRVAALTAGARATPPDLAATVELPGAQTQHHHLFSKVR